MGTTANSAVFRRLSAIATTAVFILFGFDLRVVAWGLRAVLPVRI